MASKKIILTVTNNLSYDQRMQRICHSLSSAGYDVLLVGRTTPDAPAITQQLFRQKRIYCFFQKGKLFYAEFNIRLFFFLLFRSSDLLCAIDLDTILPCYLNSRFKKTIRVYDAHELFCEMQEIVERPAIYRFWKWVERHTVPHFTHGYTVNEPIAKAFEELYGVQYNVIRNVPTIKELKHNTPEEKWLLYQGAVNEGRCFETLIPAMQKVKARLIICGDGNFMPQAKALVKKYGLEDKIIFKGMIAPDALPAITASAYLGITLFDPLGKSNYYSLANRFFDYIQAGIPQLCVDYPVYRAINEAFEVALLIKEPSEEKIADSLNNLLENHVLYERLKKSCMEARKIYHWQREEEKLIAFYHQLFE